MAKFVNITYGTHGDSEEYTYVVNNNVRVGDVIQPSVRHYKSHKIFGTTGVVMSTAKTTTAKGQEMSQKAQEKNGYVAEVKTGKELGIQKSYTRESGRFAKQYGDDSELSQYVYDVREGNVKVREQQETFDSYSQQFRSEK